MTNDTTHTNFINTNDCYLQINVQYDHHGEVPRTAYGAR